MIAASFTKTGPAKTSCTSANSRHRHLPPAKCRVHLARRARTRPTSAAAERASRQTAEISARDPAQRRRRRDRRRRFRRAAIAHRRNASGPSTRNTAARSVPLRNTACSRAHSPCSFPIVSTSRGRLPRHPGAHRYHAIMLDGTMRGKTLLVQGGAGAVGAYAVQFAETRRRNGHHDGQLR